MLNCRQFRQNMIEECNSYWQNITCTGRIWLILTEHDLYWHNLTSIGRISLVLAEYDFHWQNMIYTGLLSLLLAEYAANQKCSAVLLCSADSIYPRICGLVRTKKFQICTALIQGRVDLVGWLHTEMVYIGWSDITESIATIRSPFCGYKWHNVWS